MSRGQGVGGKTCNVYTFPGQTRRYHFRIYIEDLDIVEIAGDARVGRHDVDRDWVLRRVAVDE